MGFRTTFVTQFITPDEPFIWPDWFYEQWKDKVFFAKTWDEKPTTPIASYSESKFYYWKELIEDIQKAIPWDEYERKYKGEIMNHFVIYFAPECGGIECVHIMRDSIRTTRPVEWEEDEEILSTHGDWCNSCRWKGLPDNPWKQDSVETEPPPIVTGSYAEKQLLVQGAEIIRMLIEGFSNDDFIADAKGFVEKIETLYGSP